MITMIMIVMVMMILGICFRLLHGRVDPDVLIGFNNTGNVCK